MVSNSYLVRIILSFGVFALLSMSVFGVFHSTMVMPMDGKMSDCPFMPGMNVCPMTPFEHVSLMQNFFTNIPQQQDMTLALILAISFVAATGLIWLRQLFIPPDRCRSVGYFYRNRYFSIQRLLLQLFSNGILNPKLY